MLAGRKVPVSPREVRGQFDLVILDTPPILPVPDAVTISEQVDAFILLFRFNHTPHHLFRQAIDELGPGKIIGVVLNWRQKKNPTNTTPDITGVLPDPPRSKKTTR